MVDTRTTENCSEENKNPKWVRKQTAEEIMKLADQYHEENWVEFKHEGFKDLIKKKYLGGLK